jgi:hypothetical protein
MTTPSHRRAFAFLAICVSYFASTAALRAQGMPLDSVLPRIATELNSTRLANSLTNALPNYANLRVWGLATGDFTNDSLPDLALSLFDPYGPKTEVRVYLFANEGGQSLSKVMERPVTFVESPIEVGLTIDGSVVTIVQKTGDQHWTQLGYTLEFGDLILVDRFETEREDVTADPKLKQRSIGHDIYRNYETLRTRENYTTGASGDEMFRTSYFTLPAYQRLRDIYPGYGTVLSDSTADFVVAGAGLRRDAQDVSIRNVRAAYDDDNIYLSASVRDDYMVGGQPSMQANDRLSLWFDTKYTGDRLNRDRRVLSRQAGYPTFRDQLDSLVTNLTVAIPKQPGRVTQVTYSSVKGLTALQQEGLKNVRAQMTFDTNRGLVQGYTLRLKIPFAFLNLETNPAKFYETVATTRDNAEATNGSSARTDELLNGTGEVATLGFTAVVYDVDDPQRATESTAQATSTYREGNPATFGTMLLEPSSLYYGEVHPTYLEQVRAGLAAAGY